MSDKNEQQPKPKPDEHDWVDDGLAFHNGEYWYKCRRCGAKDWIASYGTMDQLRPVRCPGKRTGI